MHVALPPPYAPPPWPSVPIMCGGTRRRMRPLFFVDTSPWMLLFAHRHTADLWGCQPHDHLASSELEHQGRGRQWFLRLVAV